jgi:transcription elongation factor SPT4
MAFVLMLQTFEQFEFDGCDNCDEFLRMKNNKDNIYDCTSNNFDGCVEFTILFTYDNYNWWEIYFIPSMVALMSPEDSWVAKWQRISEYYWMILSFMPNMLTVANYSDRKVKGVYAISVSGRLPDTFIRELKSRGIPYRSRDTSQRQ